ncbi:MAG: tetratricopeptide repeat protein [Bacteroidota bacterium]
MKWCFYCSFLLLLTGYGLPLFAQADTAQISQLIKRAETGNADSIDAWVSQAITLAQEDEDQDLYFATVGKAASKYMAHGAYKKAETLLEDSWGQVQSKGSLAAKEKIASSRGELFRVLGRYEASQASEEMAIDYAVQLGDSFLIAKNHLSLALVLLRRGLFSKAQQYFYQSLSAFERFGDNYHVAFVNLNLGIFYGMNGNDSVAAKCFLSAVSEFRKMDHPRKLSYALINLGNSYNATSQYDKAQEVLEEALNLLEKHPDERAKLNCLNQIGRSLMRNDQAKAALPYLKEAVDMAEKSKNTYYLYLSYNYLAQAYNYLGRHQLALSFAQKAQEHSEALGPHQESPNALETLYITYRNLEQYEPAYFTLVQFMEVKDSLFNEAKSRQLARLQTEFDVQQREREILLLEQEAETERLRKNAFGFGLLATVILGGLIVWNLITRQRKDREITARKQEVEAEKLKNAQLEKERLGTELSFKQRELEQKERELSSQILQLAQKNDLLRNLKEEVNRISPHLDKEGLAISRRLSHTLERNLSQEADWEVFLDSFKSLHKDFFVHLSEQHSGLSANELRLIALMKMNLSSKEIADLLHVTDAAVKKSRYRLRKKLGISSEVNLQAYFVGKRFEP